MGIAKVGIVGSGVMGTGIAEVAAKAGHDVVLRSRQQDTADAFVSRLEKSLAKQVEREKLDSAEMTAVLGRVVATDHLGDLLESDIVVECIVEDLDLKREMFAELDDLMDERAILVSNTSTFPIVELATRTARPDRVCGMHFFNPAPVMKLVEVVRPVTASDETIGAVIAFAEGCGKSPVEVEDRAGFIVNRLLFGYFGDAVRMLENGMASAEDIDTAMQQGCNYPMGPFALMDLIGLDVVVGVFDALHAEYGESRFACHPRLRRLNTAGHLGRKTGKGFFDYT